MAEEATRFVIVGMPRTGSTLLLTGLQQHPQIQAYGELFHPSDAERTGPHAMMRGNERLYFRRDQDAIEFLEHQVFSKVQLGKKVIGFKLFGEHLRVPGTDKLFARLRDTFPTLKVIQIVRENYFEVLVSREMARKTGQWIQYKSAAPKESSETPTLRIDIEQAKTSFNSLRQVDNFFGTYFPKEQLHLVKYANLSRDYVNVMTGVYDFLGVPRIRATSSITKQIQKDLREIVVNYDDLRKAFEGTQFSKFFN